MNGRKYKRSEQTRALILYWITKEGKMSLDALYQRLQQYNRNYSSVTALSQVMKVMVQRKIIVKVSPNPNPEYGIPNNLNPLKGGVKG